MFKNDIQNIGMLYEKCINKPPVSSESIAKKYDISVDEVEKALDKGQKVEMEHTTDKKVARTIASHHLDEMIDYYDKLAKMEN